MDHVARNLPWLLRMEWRDLFFAHWRVSPDVLSAALPAGCEPDLFEGEAWISIVPFVMADIRARGLMRFPGFAYVPELNLRTYVRIRGREAVWFFSLDAASRAVVAAARATTRLAYYVARIELREADGGFLCESERLHRGAQPAEFAARYRPTGEAAAAAPGSLEAFLHERYHFATATGRGFLYGEVRHEPYRLAPAEVEISRNTLDAQIGLDLGRPPDRCWFSPGVSVMAAPHY